MSFPTHIYTTNLTYSSRDITHKCHSMTVIRLVIIWPTIRYVTMTVIRLVIIWLTSRYVTKIRMLAGQCAKWGAKWQLRRSIWSISSPPGAMWLLASHPIFPGELYWWGAMWQTSPDDLVERVLEVLDKVGEVGGHRCAAPHAWAHNSWC
eukprot:6740216-Karenia_brevis.AAC.1